MAVKDFYNKKEVDAILTETKNSLLKQIEETVTVGTSFPEKHTNAKQTLTLKVIRQEVK